MSEITVIQLSQEELRAIIRNEVSAILKEELKNLSASSGTNVFLTIEQAAEYICFSPDHLRKMCQQRKIVAHKVSNKWLFKKSDLDEFVSQGRIFTDVQISNASERIINKILQ